MRPLALLAIGLAAALLWLALSGETPWNTFVDGPITVDDERRSAELVETQEWTLVEAAEDGPAPSRVAAPIDEPDEVAEPAADRCVVTGVAVDIDGEPIVGALVQLGGYREWSAEGEAKPIASFGPYRWTTQVGFEIQTGADGSFRLDAPVPVVPRTALAVLPDPFHDAHQHFFGGDRPGYGPALTAGTRDVGTIQLGPTGSIFGRVSDEGGAPLEGVKMGIGPGPSTTYGRHAITRADGTYALGHAPEGTYGVKTELIGYLREFQDGVTVETGRETGPIDFVLQSSPTIEGRVVDERGAPVAGVRVGGWPESSGRYAKATTEDDGSFTIYLPQDEPYALGATHPDFVTWGDENDKSTVYAPGMTALQIQLARAVKTRFLVIDDESGEPIERFGFRVIEDNGSQARGRIYTERRRPTLEDRPGGIVESAGRTGVDLYVVFAEGYLLGAGDIAHDEEGEPVQTIRLQRGARLVGRAVRDGEPMADLDVTVEALRESSRGLRVADNTLQRARTKGDGTFTFEGLSASPHRLTFKLAEGAPAVVDHMERPEPGATIDLGDVPLVAGGGIAGVVVLPGGVDPSGLTLRLDDWRGGPEALTDRTGAFAFHEVSAGEHKVFLEERPGEIDSGVVATIEVPSGETVETQLDLTSFVLVPIEIRLDHGGLPVEGVRVQLLALDAPEFPSFEERFLTRIQLGRTDSDGVVRGHGRAIGTCRVEGLIEHPTERIDVVVGQPVSATVSFELASLAIELPPGLVLPADGRLGIELRPPGERFATRSFAFDVADGAIAAPSDLFARFEDGRIEVDGLAPGPKDVTVYATAADAPEVMVDLGGGSFRGGPERSFELTGSVLVELERRATLTLR